MIRDDIWIARGFWDDLVALWRQRKLAWTLYIAEVAEIRRNSGLGLLAPLLSVLTHVLVLGSVMALVFGEPIDVFLPFFAVSFAVWQAMSSHVSETAHSNDQSHRYLGFPQVSGSIVHLVRFFGFATALGLKCAAALAVIAVIAPTTIFNANYPATTIGIVALSACMLAWSIPVAFLFDRFRILRGFLPQFLLAVYLLTPILWPPERLADHQWISTLNPVFHLVELVRSPMLSGHWPLLSLSVTFALIVVGFLTSGSVFKANRRLIVYRWIS